MINDHYSFSRCQSSVFPCATPSDYATDLGKLTFVGPRPLTQMRTCVSGQTCSIDSIVGQDMSPLDSFAILDTCGGSVEIDKFPDHALPAANTTQRIGQFNIGQEVIITAAGGTYQLCWCHPVRPGGIDESGDRECALVEDHITQLGYLYLIGPSPLDYDRTCVSGQTCMIDGIHGTYVQDHDQLLLLDTCGANTLTEALPSNSAIGVTSSGSTQTFLWAPTPVSGAGGEYRMCWCAAGFSCSYNEQFRVDLGRLLLEGPAPQHQDRTCISGRNCIADHIMGYGLSTFELRSNETLLDIEASLDHGRALVLDTCGVDETVPRFPGNRMMRLTDRSTAVTWGGTPVTAKGGTYMLCWCSHHYSCERGSDFRSRIGQLIILGPTPLSQDRTCVSGRQCNLEALQPDFFPGWNVKSRVMILDECGSGTAVVPRAAGSFSGFSEQLVVTVVGGQYRLCWCYMYVYMCMYIYIYIYIHIERERGIHTHLSLSIYIYIYTYIHKYIYIYIYIYLYLYIYVYVYVYVCTHTYTYIHIIIIIIIIIIVIIIYTHITYIERERERDGCTHVLFRCVDDVGVSGQLSGGAPVQSEAGRACDTAEDPW